ncbi:ATP synthase subunit I [Aggregatibacter actinomycetemcomitans]|uniref:ATP synthase subunit I n=1 Tax=Aggregatibacter actinomycetemcomitans TaxID=714 RepID=UPI0011D57D8C|nr:ATP synthase subunit I [Aggregatibacter actinomycetemcomitans]TYA28542.1 F0F1 ATP synthase subunit I [Aggregatibacter actinomycetemcomitans]TYA42568.1 F0F1 ATP synthase subunit I [Aggregatibacter actinomycetemcomitans]TYA99327.1 F0F1 ATP synthase subunit I [Aggregatibacter actinomycetemcomitans]TYB10307.1 F0F1 ATP synthase subunit I [Aggregatibacter actinomycetemcomitans]TYB13580.1 F0F1 ATP synthase subunit I [Aggregatibacter actinomycetemcomitans]
MSIVLAQARAKYKKSIYIEFFVGLVLSSIIALLANTESAVDFCLGFFAAFIPFFIFVYVVFYRNQDLSKKLTALYRGEAIKFVLTILLIIFSFKWLSVTYFIVFFTGFFTALMLNNIIPFLLNRS